MSGPPPMPVEKKRLLGNPGHQKLPAAVQGIAPAVKIPKPSRALQSALGRRIWRRVWSRAWPWLSEATDLEILTRLVENYEFREQIRETLVKESLTSRGSMGQRVQHPLLRQLNQTERLIISLEQHCGLTPADRSRLGMVEIAAASKLDDLNQRRADRQARRTLREFSERPDSDPEGDES